MFQMYLVRIQTHQSNCRKNVSKSFCKCAP